MDLAAGTVRPRLVRKRVATPPQLDQSTIRNNAERRDERRACVEMFQKNVYGAMEQAIEMTIPIETSASTAQRPKRVRPTPPPGRAVEIALFEFVNRLKQYKTTYNAAVAFHGYALEPETFEALLPMAVYFNRSLPVLSRTLAPIHEG